MKEMMMSDLFKTGLALLMIALAIGWIMNVVAVFSCDFASPYRCEAIRIVGIPFVPLGGAVGWLDLGN